MRRDLRAGLLIGICLAGGCSVSGNTAALESRVRAYEDRVATLSRELDDVQDELVVARRESTQLRKQAADSGEIVLASEQSEVLFRAEGLRINKLLTGGLNQDDEPGDEVLSVVMSPLDSQDEPIKLPGEVTIELLDPAIEGEEKVIGTWTYSPEETREAWHTGLFVAGFKFRLSWQSPPRHETLVVHARLETADGRSYDATETVRIDISPEPTPLPESL